MTVREALREGHLRLADRGIETPRLDASLLLAEALGATREQVLARLPDSVEAAALDRYRDLLVRRTRGIPVSYLRGRKEFWGLSFAVGPEVLVPRPETELLVELAAALAPAGARVHDACTGSGCVAIALASERPDLDVSASDASPAVEPVFLANCRSLLGRELRFSASDLLAGVSGAYDLVTANPPYLRDAEARAMKARGWPEPELALAGGRDGLEVARRLVEQAPLRLCAGGRLLIEADPDQMADLGRSLAGRGFDEIERSRDLAGRERVVVARWRG